MPSDCFCASPEHEYPLASFCDDDLYCPQCGGKVAWLRSVNELPNPNPAIIKTPDPLLWVYATELNGKGNRFAILFEYDSLNENRDRKSRDLVLDESRCEVKALNWPYRFDLEFKKEIVRGETSDGARFEKTRYLGIRLKADPKLETAYKDEWRKDDNLLPAQGIACVLNLVGNCGEHTFGLLVSGEPQFEVEVNERNGQSLPDAPPEDADFDEKAWAVSKRGIHELVIQIRCVKGYLYLPPVYVNDNDENPGVTPPPEGEVLSRKVPPDRILGPGHDPCEVVIRFDARDWKPLEFQLVHVSFSAKILLTDQVSIPLYLEPRGVVSFLPADELRIPTMYYREVELSKNEDLDNALFSHIKVSNSGEKEILLRRPKVVARSLPELDWIEVFWVPREEKSIPDPYALKGDDVLELGVKIDLTRVNATNHPPREPLIATIVVDSLNDDRSPWTLPVLVQLVENRKVLESPLAIDFGNSNSYAVYMRNGRLIPLLGGKNPENFPTAIYFEDNPDKGLSKVFIGREAIKLGEEAPSRMVRWLLKRWLLVDQVEWNTPWPIRTPRGQLFECKRADLIRIFLEKLIHDCENSLRQTVTRIGLSYPANFSPRARKRLDEVIEDLEARRKADYPHLKSEILVERISTYESSPDEASAVAIGFVHDQGQFESQVKPQLGPDQTFLVASYDFGGGSIDSALLRFKSVGFPLPQFESKHLSFGGDENFGGDNVTTAVTQVLLKLFRGLLKLDHPRSEFLVAEVTDGPAVGTDRWNNYQHLRVLAEELKRFLCLRASHPDPENEPTTPDNSSMERIEASLIEFFGRIKIKEFEGGTTELRERFGQAMHQTTLDQVYDHRIILDADLDLDYTVRQRVTASIEQLLAFTRIAGGEADTPPPLFIVLAGSACRLPLVGELLRAKLPTVHLIGDPLRDPNARPKSKVAFGLARYLDYLVYTPGTMENLSRAGHYTHGPIVWRGGGGVTIPWVPSCFPLNVEKWHRLDGVPLKICLRPGRKIDIYHSAYKLELIGTFDLSQPATEGDNFRLKELPTQIDGSAPSEILLKVNGSEDQLLLMVRLGKDDNQEWREFGDWRLTTVAG